MLEVNKIYNMDCLEGMKILDDNSIDLVVTSPPYDNNRTYWIGVIQLTDRDGRPNVTEE